MAASLRLLKYPLKDLTIPGNEPHNSEQKYTLMNRVKLTIAASVVVAFLGAIGTIFLPQHGDQLVGLRYHIFLAYPWIFTVLYLGASAAFLMGLKNFRTRAKLAYTFLCVGLIIMVLAQAQLGLITYFDAWLGAWVHRGFIMLPYVFGGLVTFVGIRLFSRLLKIKTIWNSFRFVIPVTVVVVLLATRLPHRPDDFVPEVIFDTSLGFMVWSALLSTFAVIVTLHVKRTITPVFTKAMAWLFLALVVHTFGAWQIAAFQLIGFQHWYNELGFVILPFIISGLFLLRAGYEFNKASEY